MAVEFVWAHTGRLTNDAPSREVAAKLPEARLEYLKAAANNSNNPRETEYISRALLAMEVCIRNMDIIYLTRQLNFEDNRTLRSGYLP